MQKQQAKKSIAKRFLRVIALLLILGLVVFFLAKNGNAEWQELTKHSFQLNFWFLALAFAGFLLQELSYGFIWRSVLSFGQRSMPRSTSSFTFSPGGLM